MLSSLLPRRRSGVLHFALLFAFGCSDAHSPPSAPPDEGFREPSSSDLEVGASAAATRTIPDLSKRPSSELDGSWDPARELDVAAVDSAAEGKLAGIGACENGDAIAVWSRIGRTMDIYASRYSDATGSWSKRVQLNQARSVDARAPVIAVNAECEAIAVWEEGEDQSLGRTKTTLVGAAYFNDAWQPASPLVTITSEQWFEGLRASIAESGDAFVTYRIASHDEGAAAMSQAFTKSYGFAQAEQVAGKNIVASDAATLASGELLYVLTEQVDTVSKSRYIARSADGTWSEPTLLGEGYTLSRVIVGERRFFAAGKLREKTVVAMQLPGQKVDLVPVATPSESLTSKGERLLAYWGERNGASGVLRVSEYVAGKGFGAAQTVSNLSDDVSLVDDFSVVLDGTGRGIATYIDRNTNELKTSRLTTSGWTRAEVLAEHGVQPRLSATRNGEVFIAWTTLEPWSIKVARFVPHGASNAE